MLTYAVGIVETSRARKGEVISRCVQGGFIAIGPVRLQLIRILITELDITTIEEEVVAGIGIGIDSPSSSCNDVVID